MLSSVLTSETAAQVNIQIMRAFTMMRKTLSAIIQTERKQEQLEMKVERLSNYIEDILRDQNDTNELVGAQMEAINESLAELAAKVEDLTSTPAPRKKIGFDQ